MTNFISPQAINESIKMKKKKTLEMQKKPQIFSFAKEIKNIEQKSSTQVARNTTILKVKGYQQQTPSAELLNKTMYMSHGSANAENQAAMALAVADLKQKTKILKQKRLSEQSYIAVTQYKESSPERELKDDKAKDIVRDYTEDFYVHEP